MSPLDQLWCRIQFHRVRYRGTYTPPAVERPTVFFPGFNGGVDWGGAAVHPERHLLVINNNHLPNTVQLLTQEQVQERDIRAIGEGVRTTGGDYAQRGLPYGARSVPWRTALGVPCTAPPWGYLGVIDLNTREFVWRVPLGTGHDHGPFGIPSMLPITMGTPNNGGSLVTRSGLIVIAAALDRVIRAFDLQTGELLWQAELPAGGQAGRPHELCSRRAAIRGHRGRRSQQHGDDDRRQRDRLRASGAVMGMPWDQALPRPAAMS